MAFLDNALLLSNAQAITATAASTNLYDVTGSGSGVVPPMVFGTTGVAGFDIGLADGASTPMAYFTVTTAFVSGGGATLQFQIQAAPDNGSGSPGTYTTLYTSATFAASTLVAGAQLVVPVPPIVPGEALPRFYRFNYVVATSTFSAGAVTGGIIINAPSKLENTLYPNNFTAL